MRVLMQRVSKDRGRFKALAAFSTDIGYGTLLPTNINHLNSRSAGVRFPDNKSGACGRGRAPR